MNLSTHTAYPEITINGDTFDWVFRILNRDGSVCKAGKGTAKNHKSAREHANAEVAKIESNYLIEVK